MVIFSFFLSLFFILGEKEMQKRRNTLQKEDGKQETIKWFKVLILLTIKSSFSFFFSIFKKIIYFFKKAGTANNLRKLIKNSNFWWREWRLVQFGMWEKLPITLLKTLRFSLEPKLIPPLQEDRSIRDGSIPSTLPLMNFQSEWSPIWSGFLSFFIKFFYNLTFFVKKKKKKICPRKPQKSQKH